MHAQVEEVGNIVGGLSCVSWSPDHELCALATRTNRSILLMTKEWNVIAEVPSFPLSSSSSSPLCDSPMHVTAAPEN